MKTQMVKKMVGAVFLAAAMFGLSACSGGGGSAGAGSSSAAVIQGAAMFGPVANGAVKAYALNADGSLSTAVLASATTNQNGAYTMTLSHSGPVALVLSSGSYVEEGSGQPVTLLRSYISILPSASGQVSSAITPLSHAAWKAFQAAVASGIPSGTTLADQVNLANSKVSQAFGVAIQQIPSNPFGQLSNDEAGKHAIVLAAFSKAAVDMGSDSGALAEAYGKLLGQNGNLSSVSSISVMDSQGQTSSVTPPSISQLQTVVNNVGSGTTVLSGVQAPVGFQAPTLVAAPAGSTFNLAAYAELVVDDVDGDLSMTGDMKITSRIPYFNGILNGNGHTIYVSLPEVTRADGVSQACIDAIGSHSFTDLEQAGYPTYSVRSNLCRFQGVRFNRPMDSMNAPLMELGLNGQIKNVKIVYVSDLKAFGSLTGLVLINDGLIQNVQISQMPGVVFRKTALIGETAPIDYFINASGAVALNRGQIRNVDVDVTLHTQGSRAHAVYWNKGGVIDSMQSTLRIYTVSLWQIGPISRTENVDTNITNSFGSFTLHWDASFLPEGTTAQQIQVAKQYLSDTFGVPVDSL